MTDLESEEYAKHRKNKEGEGLKILTPDAQQITNYFSLSKSRK